MDDAKDSGMQCLTLKTGKRNLCRSVNLISKKRMTDARHMNTDLMSPPSLQLAFHIGKAAKALQKLLTE